MEGAGGGSSFWLLWQPEPVTMHHTEASAERRRLVPLETLSRIAVGSTEGPSIFEVCAPKLRRVWLAKLSSEAGLYIPPRWECVCYITGSGVFMTVRGPWMCGGIGVQVMEYLRQISSVQKIAQSLTDSIHLSNLLNSTVFEDCKQTYMELLDEIFQLLFVKPTKDSSNSLSTGQAIVRPPQPDDKEVEQYFVAVVSATKAFSDEFNLGLDTLSADIDVLIKKALNPSIGFKSSDEDTDETAS